MDYGLYFHIPFCIKKCSYCDFLSFPSFTVPEPDKEKYFTALKDEWIIKSYLFDGDVDSIYIGGGTPSCVDPLQIYDLVRSVKATKTVKDYAEITIEVNPGTVTWDHFDIYKKAGINRISIGVQSTHDRLLRSLGRIHNASDSEEAFLMAKNSGFKDISCDLIFGIPQINGEPGEIFDELCEDIERVSQWGANHISAYSIIIEPDTPLNNLSKAGKVVPIDDALERQMYYHIRKYLNTKRIFQYEISNYARRYYKSRHNLKYWDCLPYLGLGLGASSYYPAEKNNPACDYIRSSNTRELKDYCAGLYFGTQETISIEEQMYEFMMLGFRKMKGPSPEKFQQRFGCSYFDKFAQPLSALAKKGLVDLGESAKLTKLGLDYANQVFGEFLYEEESH